MFSHGAVPADVKVPTLLYNFPINFSFFLENSVLDVRLETEEFIWDFEGFNYNLGYRGLPREGQKHAIKNAFADHFVFLLLVQVQGRISTAEKQPNAADVLDLTTLVLRNFLHERFAVMPETAERGDSCAWTDQNQWPVHVFRQMEAWRASHEDVQLVVDFGVV